MGKNLTRTKEIVDSVDRISGQLADNSASQKDVNFTSMAVIGYLLLPEIALSLASIADSLEAMKEN